MIDPCEKVRKEKEEAKREFIKAKKSLEDHLTDPLNREDDSTDKYNKVLEELRKNLSEKELSLEIETKSLHDCEK